jgi:hypothetical protein
MYHFEYNVLTMRLSLIYAIECSTYIFTELPKDKTMKTLFLSALLVSGAFTSMAADNPSLTGKWKIHQSVAGNDSDSDCTFTQNDDGLSGSCTADSGSGQIAGKVEGTKVSFSYETQYNGSPLTVKYMGTLDSAGKITGSVVVEEFSVDGDFTATPAKKEN